MTDFLLTDGDFRSISALLEEAAGISLPTSKKTLVYSRLVKRLRAVGASTFAEYRKLLERDDAERRRMVEALTTNTTSFFREPHHFEHLKSLLSAHLIPAARSGQRIRIWSAACSTGEEPYSIAFTILSCLPHGTGNLDIKILATDINTLVVEKAKNGVYSKSAIEALPRGLEQKYFEKVPGSGSPDVAVCKAARDLISFRTLNLQEAWPMKGTFDAIFCRNVMIYFSPDTQSRLWQRFSTLLRPDGVLYIGHSERVAGPATVTMKNIAPTTYSRFAGEAT
jgi:chemotaxis protein methyltransferase CheR